MVAMRPWSFPATLVPIALTGAVLHKSHGVDLLSLKYACTFVLLLTTHAGANLTNTYFDFINGADKKDSGCDDRSLVDGKVNAQATLKVAQAMLLFTLGAAGCLAVVVDPKVLYTATAGVALGFFYTADPICLKKRALGDVVVFLCFGPVLMAMVSIVLVREVTVLVLAYSIPMGLLTVAILHANNTRDVKADSSVGYRTVAMALGGLSSNYGNYYYYCALISASYATVVALSFTQGVLTLFVAVTVPWAVYLVRCFDAALLQELPQRTAQHNLLFGAVLTTCLATSAFRSRLLLACLFYLGGVNNIMVWTYSKLLVRQKMLECFLRLPEKNERKLDLYAAVLLGSAVAMQLGSSMCFIVGVYPRLMAKVMLAFLIPVTVIVHDFWTIEGGEKGTGGGGQGHYAEIAPRAVPNFATEFDSEFVHFFKNACIAGGLCVYLEIA